MINEMKINKKQGDKLLINVLTSKSLPKSNMYRNLDIMKIIKREIQADKEYILSIMDFKVYRGESYHK